MFGLNTWGLPSQVGQTLLLHGSGRQQYRPKVCSVLQASNSWRVRSLIWTVHCCTGAPRTYVVQSERSVSIWEMMHSHLTDLHGDGASGSVKADKWMENSPPSNSHCCVGSYKASGDAVGNGEHVGLIWDSKTFKCWRGRKGRRLFIIFGFLKML